MMFPRKTRAEIKEIVREALLQLHNEGLVSFFTAPYDEGFSVDPAHFVRLTRTRLEDELVRAWDGYDEDDECLFFVETAKGREYFYSLPREAIPRVSGLVPPWPDDPD